ncbi:VPLPA-CTERM sorting domain-containing protein [uncultured Roseobacter sp.]|uniref:VPLPA-CTERM sorting domain-containing protein n=1 Tax=uncultured Roseobacter sp. TaxID=114847 RepID=UPI00262BB08C|nr:VPLPA-CTERM sorting domain-containing protein [uncultured Roseobacter sp.]
MKAHVFSASAIAALCAGTAFAAPISADSALTLYHSYTVNSGSAPAAVRISTLPGSLVLQSDLASTVDDPTATNTTSVNTVIGNPFADPVVPFSSERTDETTLPGGSEGSAAAYSVEITAVDDPEADPFVTSIVERTINNSGSASAEITSDPVAAAARASFRNERGYLFENTSDALVSFNIAGDVRASFLSTYDGTDGFSRASGTLFSEFGSGIGAEVGYLPLAPYLRTITEEGEGAMVAETLATSGEGFDGFVFSAATSAPGTGSPVEAALDVTFRYLFSISLEPGGSLEMRTGFRQFNAVEYAPGPSPVPLPASLSFLLAGLVGLGVARRCTRA